MQTKNISVLSELCWCHADIKAREKEGRCRKDKPRRAAGSSMILADKVLALRKKKGWSQEELAEKLGISRQSVSKWESGASIPDIDKIIAMSGLFGVSTDYLLKDELETEGDSPQEVIYEEPEGKSVSLEEADSFVRLKRKLALPVALGAALCVLSPVPLLLLGGLSEFGSRRVSEDMAGGLGIVFLLIIIAAGVAILVMSSMKLEKYDYLEKENVALQYGVRGIIEKNREEFLRANGIAVTLGTVLCILGVVPLMVAAAFSAPDMVYVYCVALLLLLVAAAVFLFVWSESIKGSFDMLLQEGEYTLEEKYIKKRTAFFPGVYWCLTVAVFLALGFRGMEWSDAGYVWPIAALLFAVLWIIVRAVARRGADSVKSREKG